MATTLKAPSMGIGSLVGTIKKNWFTLLVVALIIWPGTIGPLITQLAWSFHDITVGVIEQLVGTIRGLGS